MHKSGYSSKIQTSSSSSSSNNKYWSWSWSSFEIATGIKKENLINFSLQNVDSFEFRNLLASEIRELTILTISLTDKQLLFPICMLDDNVKKIFLDYQKAVVAIQGFIDIYNNASYKSLSMEELDELKNSELKKNGFFYYTDEYNSYLKQRDSVLIPAKEAFFAYSENKNTYLTYIKAYYQNNNNIIFFKKQRKKSVTSIIDIAGKMLEKIIVIFQVKKNDLKEIYRTVNFSIHSIKIFVDELNNFYSETEFINQKRLIAVANLAKPSLEFDAQLDSLDEKFNLVAIKPDIEAEKLITKIDSLFKKFSEKDTIQCLLIDMKYELDEIRYYFNNPDKVKKATFSGGLEEIQAKFNGKLLKIDFYLKYSEIIPKAKNLIKILTQVVQQYKIKKAYAELRRGKKNIQAGWGKPPKVYSIKEINPIQEQSIKNLEILKKNLIELNGNCNNNFGLREDEIELFSALLSLPYKLQHATNHYYPALNSGRLKSYAELKRYNNNYESIFSTNGNVNLLGNDGFVFFRLFVEPINNSKTRYGDTSVFFDLSLLQENGWISLHDQLKPFPHKSSKTRHLYQNKRLLRTSEAIPICCNVEKKNMFDGLLYKYRSSPINSYTEGKKDLVSLDKFDFILRRASFLEEIFYGKDMLRGIAFSVIRELRYLELCGFRNLFLEDFQQANDQVKVNILGELIKSFFRIEGKYPVGIKLKYDIKNEQYFFSTLGYEQKIVKGKYNFENGDGDGRYDVNMNANREAMEHSKNYELYKKTEEKLSVARRLRNRFIEDPDKYNFWKEKIFTYEKNLEEKKIVLNEDSRFRENLINYFEEILKIEKSKLEKIDTTKLNLIYCNYNEPLENEEIAFDDLVSLNALQLNLIADTTLLELVFAKYLTLQELAQCTPEELEIFLNCEIKPALLEHSLSFSQILLLYRENPLHLRCLTCNDIFDLVLEFAPEVNSIVMEYADDVDFNEVKEQLCETDGYTFDLNLSNYFDEGHSPEGDDELSQPSLF